MLINWSRAISSGGGGGGNLVLLGVYDSGLLGCGGPNEEFGGGGGGGGGGRDCLIEGIITGFVSGDEAERRDLGEVLLE